VSARCGPFACRQARADHPVAAAATCPLREILAYQGCQSRPEGDRTSCERSGQGGGKGSGKESGEGARHLELARAAKIDDRAAERIGAGALKRHLARVEAFPHPGRPVRRQHLPHNINTESVLASRVGASDLGRYVSWRTVGSNSYHIPGGPVRRRIPQPLKFGRHRHVAHCRKIDVGIDAGDEAVEHVFSIWPVGSPFSPQIAAIQEETRNRVLVDVRAAKHRKVARVLAAARGPSARGVRALR
jgi:hypothetical protein